jgi:acetoin utilization protein AcuB
MQDALNLMQQERMRRFPVVDKRGRLVGIVSDKDLLNASPSEATSLSIYEVNYLLSKLTVKEIMNRDVITITDDTPLEEAARIMADNKIGGLPVLRDNEVTGIITETDLFKIFLELLGAREPGVRISALVQNIPGELAKLTKVIFNLGGNIVALGTFLGESSENREISIKVADVDAQTLEEAIKPIVEKIVDIRET